VWGMFSWHTLGPLVPIGHRLNATAYLSIVSDQSIPLWTPLMASSSRIMHHHVTKLESFQIGFLNMTMSSLYYNCPPQSVDLNPIEHIWDVVERELHALDVHPTNLHQLQDAVQSIWANISKECFQQLVESMPRRINSESERGSNTLLVWCS